MNNQPLVSVIIAVHNGEHTIAETIQSVLNQTISDIELIIINDGSTDNTLDIIHNFQDSRISVHSISNSGPSVARNKGIEVARCKYLSFIDADDLWINNKLEKQLDIIQQLPEVEIVYCWTMFIDENGVILHPLKPLKFEGDVYENILVNNFIGSGSNILVSKEALQLVGKFDATLTYAEEWDLLIRLSKKYKFSLVKEYLVYYRQYTNSLSSNIDNLEKGTIKVIEKAYKDVPVQLLKLKSKSLSSLYSYISYLYLTRQNDVAWKSKSLSNAVKSIFTAPETMNIIKNVLIIFIVIFLVLFSAKSCRIIVRKILRIYGYIQNLINRVNV